MKNFAELAKKIVCVGRNYAKHAAEMGYSSPESPGKPVIFLKPPSAFLFSGGVVKIPDGCQNLHHEVELAVVISMKASRISRADASSYIAGYALALDMTARDFQEDAKKNAKPWLLAKGFDGSCPISAFLSTSELPADPLTDSEPGSAGVEFWCKVNGKERQRGNTRDMIFKIDHLLEFITKYVTLDQGDVVLTGTPEGVSRVVSGDKIEAGIGDKRVLDICITD